MKRLFLLAVLFFTSFSLAMASDSLNELKGGADVFPIRTSAYSKKEVLDRLMPTIHSELKPLITAILDVFFHPNFPKTPFTIPEEIKCWQCFYNTLQGEACATNSLISDTSLTTQRNAIATFLGHHKTTSVSSQYPEIFNLVSEDYPHMITNEKNLIDLLVQATKQPIRSDQLRSSL